jgi:hypothetical protein
MRNPHGNAFNLGEQWTSASSTFFTTTSTISAIQSTAIYRAPFAVNVATAAVAPATGTLSGDVGVTSNSTASNSISIADVTLDAGAEAVTGAVLGTEAVTAGVSGVIAPASIAYIIIASTQLQPGSDSIMATYSGDANYQAEAAATISVSIAGTFTTTITPGSVTIAPSGIASDHQRIAQRSLHT